MAATAERRQLTEMLLDEVQETGFPRAAQLDRIERLISTREELEDYIAILVQKVEATRFPDHHLLDRLERLTRVLQRFDREARSER
jgi:uncharacterized protein YggL (DUF469 family)